MGCWNAPFKEEQAKEIRELMKAPLTPSDAEDKLYHLVGDDELYDKFIYAAEDGLIDVRDIILNFLQTWFGNEGDSDEIRDSWRFKHDFEAGALAIFKDMLTDYHRNNSFPT